jgi:hypothetical protein
MYTSLAVQAALCALEKAYGRAYLAGALYRTQKPRKPR